jgi:UDP-N-acetylglucosamine 1-carboxyvinyltransferase
MAEKIYFEVEGGRKLKGEITPQGAKNESLQILCAVLLTEEKVTIHNIPAIRDVLKLIDLLTSLGVRVEKLSDSSYEFEAKEVDIKFLETDEFKTKAASLRGSIMILGPLLTRFGQAKMPRPGGDKIGRRRLDTHFLGFEKLGAKFSYDFSNPFYEIDASELKGACEPYIQQLCRMLNRMGANIQGAGSNLINIEGVGQLGGTTHTMLPDMIEIGSFIGLAAMTGSELTIKNARVDELGLIPNVFRKLGIQLEIRNDDIYIPAQESYEIDRFIDGSILTVADGPWPLFTPDLLSIVLVVATQARGTVMVHQKMFESRLFFVDKLIDMGAQIILCDPHRATVIGLDKQVALRGISMTSPDIRAGVSLLIAALSAEGSSTIYNAEQIDRGYQFIDKRLNALGANIKRVSREE